MPGNSNTRDGRSRDTVKPMRHPLNKYLFAATVLSSATPLFLGYDLAVVYNTIVRAQGDVKLLACTVALSSSLGMVAAVGAQRLIGDRRTVLLSAAVLCAGAIGRGLAIVTGLAPFAAGAFVNGVGMGLALTAVPAYAAELSPSSARRALAAHPDGLVYLGCILGSVVYSMGFSRTIPAHHAWWLTVAIGTAVPALLCSVVLFMPETETPRLVVSRTPEDAELRLLGVKVECGCGKPHDGSDEPPAATKRRGRWWWREELGILRELLVRPTEPLRRAVVTALVAKVFQQASSIGSILQYVQRAFHDVGVSSRAVFVFVFLFVVSFPMSLVLVELGWLLVRALARGCRLGRRRVPTGSVTVTPRQEQLKRARGLSATMLVSLMALVWIALGPAPWAADASSRGCLRWLGAAAANLSSRRSSQASQGFIVFRKCTAT